MCNDIAVMYTADNLTGSLRELSSDFRYACGAGIVLRLGRVARMELNYVVPMSVKQGDR